MNLTEQEKINLFSSLQKTFPFHINKGVVDFHVSRMMKNLNLFDFEVFLPSKGVNLQRDLVWTKEQKNSLILTMLKRQKWGTVVIVRHEENGGVLDDPTYEVIDGKQRLTTIISYIKGEFPIEYGGYQFYYDDLPVDYQKIIYHSPVIADIAYSYEWEKITDDQKIELFEYVNWLGTPQDQEHMENLRKAKK